MMGLYVFNSDVMISMKISHPVDLLIRQALVFDGTLSEPRVQDLAVREGRIVALNDQLQVQATHTVDAQGLALMPGIIDSHTHFDAQITWDAYVRPHLPWA